MGKIKLNLASGGKVEKPLLSAFKANESEYVILDNELNGSMGLPIILVCKLDQNKLIKIVDQNEWQVAKEYLKNIIAGQTVQYIKLPNELQADDIYYTQLTLPVPSFDALRESYNPDAVVEMEAPVGSEMNMNTSEPQSAEQPQVSTPNVEPVNSQVVPETPVAPMEPQVSSPVMNQEVPQPTPVASQIIGAENVNNPVMDSQVITPNVPFDTPVAPDATQNVVPDVTPNIANIPAPDVPTNPMAVEIPKNEQVNTINPSVEPANVNLVSNAMDIPTPEPQVINPNVNTEPIPGSQVMDAPSTPDVANIPAPETPINPMAVETPVAPVQVGNAEPMVNPAPESPNMDIPVVSGMPSEPIGVIDPNIPNPGSQVMDTSMVTPNVGQEVTEGVSPEGGPVVMPMGTFESQVMMPNAPIEPQMNQGTNVMTPDPMMVNNMANPIAPESTSNVTSVDSNMNNFENHVPNDVTPSNVGINGLEDKYKEQKEAFMQACENMFDALVQKLEK